MAKKIVHARHFLDRAGLRYGRLLVLEYVGNTRSITLWRCRCDCGNLVVVRGSNLRPGKGTESCGCLARDVARRTLTKHGMYRSVEYNAWVAMKQRCREDNTHKYPLYAGKGITICQGLNDSFEWFFRVLDHRPPKHSLDRIRVHEGYYCGICDHCLRMGWERNCRWATQAEQNRNKTTAVFLTFRGETRNASDWQQDLGIPRSTFWRKLYQGCTLDEIISWQQKRQRAKRAPS